MPTTRLFPDVEPPPEGDDSPLIRAEKLKPFLLHEDRHVRETASEYFYDSYSSDPDLLGLVLGACERYGDEENLLVLSRASRFEASEEDFVRTVDRLGAAEGENAQAHFGSILPNAPVEYIVRYRQEIQRKCRLIGGADKVMNGRIRMHERTPQQTWEDLRNYSQKCRNAKNVGDVNHARVGAMLDRLAGAETPTDEEILDLLPQEDPGTEWIHAWLVKLAGLRRLSAAVPQLVGYLQIDTGYYREEVCKALARIGDPHTIDLVDRTFADDPFHVRVYAADLPGSLKCRRSERFCLEQLRYLEDVRIRTMLCDGLCKLYSRRGVGAVLREIHSGYDGSIVSLEERLLEVAPVLDLDLPEAHKWRQKRGEKEQLRRERQEELNRMARSVRPEKERREKPSPASSTRPTKQAGRNDPCPCGSGRKFKRCCGDPRKNR